AKLDPTIRIACDGETKKNPAVEEISTIRDSSVSDLVAQYRNADSAKIVKAMTAAWNARDYATAVALARLAYDRDGGNSQAAYRLGTAYYGGYGVGKDLSKAWQYLSVPALDRSAYALYF